MLTDIVGAGEKRLAREIEKLAIAVHPETRATAEDVEALAAGETVAEGLRPGRRRGGGRPAGQRSRWPRSCAPRARRPAAWSFPIIGRLREVHRVVELLDSGVAEKDLGEHMKGPPWKLKKAVALARKADRETLERALCRFADLEVETRGGGPLDEDTAFTLALARAAA